MISADDCALAAAENPYLQWTFGTQDLNLVDKPVKPQLSFQLESRLGDGGMGCVFAGRQRSGSGVAGGDKVAIKLIAALKIISKLRRLRYSVTKPLTDAAYAAAKAHGLSEIATWLNHADFRRYVDRFEREAKLLSHLRHQNIVEIRQHGSVRLHVKKESPELPYLVMEFVEGETLTKSIRNLRNPDVGTARRVSTGIAGGLACMHDFEIYHCDVKPDNIVIAEDGTPVLVDLGVAKPLTAGSPIGRTVGYCPHEQYHSLQATPAMDQFALGATVFEWFTRTLPYASGNLAPGFGPAIDTHQRMSKHVPGLPHSFSDAIAVAIERDAKDRFYTMRDLIAAIMSPTRMLESSRRIPVRPRDLVVARSLVNAVIRQVCHQILELTVDPTLGSDRKRLEGFRVSVRQSNWNLLKESRFQPCVSLINLIKRIGLMCSSNEKDLEVALRSFYAWLYELDLSLARQRQFRLRDVPVTP